MTGDDCIGLHLAEHADLRTVDVHYYAMAASATLRDAFTRLSRYQRLIHETTRIDVSATAGGMALRHVLPGGFAASRQTAEFLLAAWVRIGRVVTGTEWCPVDVRFAHDAPADVSEHRRFCVADRMKMSVRTLNRALAAEGTTYRAVLNQMRGEMARRHLANPRLS